MPDRPGPTLAGFIESINLQVCRFMLSKVGSKRHEVRFVTPPSVPYHIPSHEEVFHAKFSHCVHKFFDHYFVQRYINFFDLGILCCSGTQPSLREVILHARLPEKTPIRFGQDSVLRTGFWGEKETFGCGTTYSHRIDYAKPEDNNTWSKMLVLDAGIVHYPFREHLGTTNLYHADILKRHGNEAFGEERGSVLSADEKDQLEADYKKLGKEIEVDVILILDSAELLAFHWDHESNEFRDDFYNAGLTVV